MIARENRARPGKRAGRRAGARSQRRPKTVGLLLGGASVWLTLYLLGLQSNWATYGVIGLTGLLLFLDNTATSGATRDPGRRAGRPGRPGRPARAQEPEEALAAGRGNAVTEAYNTLERTAPPARVHQQQPVVPSKVAPGKVSARQAVVLPRPALSFEERFKPLPPSLLANPDHKPLVAGETPTLRKPVSAVMEAVKVEEPAVEEPPQVEPGQVELERVEPEYTEPRYMESECMEPEFTEPEYEGPVFEESAVNADPDIPATPQTEVEATAPPAPSRPEPSAPVVRPHVIESRPHAAQGLPSSNSGYTLPTTAMLPFPQAKRAVSDDVILERAALLEHTLKTFGVEAKVVDFAFGPAVTRYELQPGPGVRVNKFTQLTDDLALALAAEDIRIEAPIPGKSAVGIEVPNKERLMVPLREVLESATFRNNPSKLTVAFGKDNAGHPVVGDLAKMPHLLIAGSTGSGKSVCMNTIICSLLFKARPDEVKMLMIDPKMVELSTYNGVPHLTAPVITDVKKAAGYLKGAVKEMEARYELFAAIGVRNIQHYNELVARDPGPDPEHPRQPLPYIVIFIDELADLMMVAPADVEDSVCRLAQMARACGMHLVIATQSPRVDVITGLIKANVPSRIAFAVSSQIDSRVIMDSAGAERLLGRGDMLYHPSGINKPLRAQGAFIDEASVEELVRFVKEQAKPTFSAQEVAVDTDQRRGVRADEAQAPTAADTVFPQAVRVVIEHGQASVSILQRRLRCNYSKAARLIDMMEERGFIGPHQGSKPRDVLLSLPQWQEMFSEETEEDTDMLA